MVKKYGLRLPFADLGGLARPTIADYSITQRTGRQHDRYITLPHGTRPFDAITPSYQIFNPEQGDPDIEGLVPDHAGEFGTIVCCNVIEHVVNPFKIFDAFYALAERGALVIVTTVFSFPYHPSPRDLWRFSPDCLDMLGKYAGFDVLEASYHLKIYADEGIREIHHGTVQEIMADFVVLRKP